MFERLFCYVDLNWKRNVSRLKKLQEDGCTALASASAALSQTYGIIPYRKYAGSHVIGASCSFTRPHRPFDKA